MANNTVWLNGISGKLIHTNKTVKGEITNVSFPVDKKLSDTGYASVSVFSAKMVKPATTKEGQPVLSKNGGDQLMNVGLGAPEANRQVSVTKIDAKGNRSYEKVEMTNQQIKDAYEASRSAYRAAVAQA